MTSCDESAATATSMVDAATHNKQLLQKLVSSMDPTVKRRPVLVTGVDGYVSGVLANLLLRLGFTVHGTYYNLGDDSNDQQAAIAQLRTDLLSSSSSAQPPTLGSRAATATATNLPTTDDDSSRLTLFYADLMVPGSFDVAMRSCGTVFHTASPFFLTNDWHTVNETLVQPAIQGTANVLRSSCGGFSNNSGTAVGNRGTNGSNTLSSSQSSLSVQRVVLTSSVGAMYCCAAEPTDHFSNTTKTVITEHCWNRTASCHHQPYFYSKTCAELTAWIMAGSQTHYTLCTINPSLILGPGIGTYHIIHRSSESVRTILKLAGGWHYTMWFGCPDFAISVVDVRDVAAAHVLAAFSTDNTTNNGMVAGRFLVSAVDTSTGALAALLRSQFLSYPIPWTTAWWISRWIVAAVAPYLRTGLDRRAVLYNMNCRTDVALDNSKSQIQLGLRYRPVTETLTDMYQQLIQAGVVQPCMWPPEVVGLTLVVTVVAILFYLPLYILLGNE
jgi:nucleoside-diphosphate-sugar epimerase